MKDDVHIDEEKSYTKAQRMFYRLMSTHLQNKSIDILISNGKDSPLEVNQSHFPSHLHFTNLSPQCRRECSLALFSCSFPSARPQAGSQWHTRLVTLMLNPQQLYQGHWDLRGSHTRVRGNRVIASLLENANATVLSRLVHVNVLFLISSPTHPHPMQTEVVLLYARVPYESHGEKNLTTAKSCISSSEWWLTHSYEAIMLRWFQDQEGNA